MTSLVLISAVFFMEMYPRTVFFITILCTFKALTTASIGRLLPFSGFYPIPPRTPEPIDIDTSRLKNITTPTPLQFYGNRGKSKAYLINTGHSVEVFSTQPYTTETITGGVLYKKEYVYYKSRFYWANSSDGVAGSVVDGGNGSPLEVSIEYYKCKYKSFQEAMKYRDGMAEIRLHINVGSVANLHYKQFAAAMKKISKPGTRVEIELLSAFSWYQDFPLNTFYYAYPGAYEEYNGSTNTTYYCTTTIAPFYSKAQFISKKQFEDTFLQLLGYNGQPLTNSVQPYPQGVRPVVLTYGITKTPSNKVVPSILKS